MHFTTSFFVILVLITTEINCRADDDKPGFHTSILSDSDRKDYKTGKFNSGVGLSSRKDLEDEESNQDSNSDIWNLYRKNFEKNAHHQAQFASDNLLKNFKETPVVFQTNIYTGPFASFSFGGAQGSHDLTALKQNGIESFFKNNQQAQPVKKTISDKEVNFLPTKYVV